MKIFKLIKQYGGLLVAGGVTLVVNTMMKDNLTTPKGFFKKMIFKVGVIAISAYAAKKVTDSFEEDVDRTEKEVIDISKKVNEEVNKTKGEA